MGIDRELVTQTSQKNVFSLWKEADNLYEVLNGRGARGGAFLGDQIFLTRPQLIHTYKGGNSFGHVKTLTKMLETLDAENFCSGHSEMTNRQGVKNHIEQMKKRQEKVKALMAKGNSLEEVKSNFDENESRLIEAIFTEVKKLPGN